MERTVNVAINGFGRIGRALLRVLMGLENVRVSAINDPAEPAVLAHLVNHDSVHGRPSFETLLSSDHLLLDNRGVKLLNVRRPESFPWAELGVEVVVDCSVNATPSGLRGHLTSGAAKVVVASPCFGADLTLVMGVNHDAYEPRRHHLVSASSPAANCLAPILKVMNDRFSVRKGLVTTIRPYSEDQNLLDQPNADLRRSRAAALSMIPLASVDAGAVEEVLPCLKGKLDGVSLCVPAPAVSLADITLLVGSKADASEVNEAIAEASRGPMEGVLAYGEEHLVGADHLGSVFSATVDGLQTRVVGSDMVKLSAWYDNEWGYASRLRDILVLMGGNYESGALPGTGEGVE